MEMEDKSLMVVVLGYYYCSNMNRIKYCFYVHTIRNAFYTFLAPFVEMAWMSFG